MAYPELVETGTGSLQANATKLKAWTSACSSHPILSWS